ncbi:MAG: glycosyltransferase family 4 protein [Chitinivibrionia bacterium]|nr:glycosyltransferase family 4 protein [Chitinivibrionia bacterium]
MNEIARKTESSGAPPVAMLTWEINPMVAGGSWTACYHLVRNLVKHGAGPTVIAPWRADCVDADPFDCTVPIILLGILGHDEGSNSIIASHYGHYVRGPAGSFPYAAYRTHSLWGYAGGSYRSHSAYTPGLGPYRPFRGGYDCCDTAADGSRESQVFFNFMRETGDLYTERLLDEARRIGFALFHAHDWVTFGAAAEVSRELGKPWIAHFHSIEHDRRPWAPDAAIERIEHGAAQSANSIITPSRLTARSVAERYGVPASKIVVIPNVLSNTPGQPVSGGFGSRRVIFLGRLEMQKAPDRFAEIAGSVRERDSGICFHVYGDGELRDTLLGYGSWLEIRGALRWSQRLSALDGAAAVLVPSRAEPFGMVVLEAMQCGVPVLYSSEAGVAEVIESGIPIRPDDVGGIADRILELLADSVLWENVALAEREEIRSYPERGYECRLMQMYAELLQGV